MTATKTTIETTPTTTARPAPARPAVTALTDPAADAAIGAACRALHLPTIRAQATAIAESAARERLSHKAYLAEVLTAECDDRDSRRRIRRVNEARFPRAKRLADFDLRTHPTLPPATLAQLASGAWIDAGEPVVLLGDSGTGKTHYADLRIMPMWLWRPLLRRLIGSAGSA